MNLPEKSKGSDNPIQTVLLTIIAAAVLAAGGGEVEIYKQLGIAQYQLGELSAKSDQYLTRNEADQRGKMRDMEMSELTNRVTAIETRLK